MDGDLRSRLRLHRHHDALGAWTVAACAPHPALRGLVAQLWYGEGRVAYRRDRILPGAGNFLLINLGPPQYRIEPGPPETRVVFDDLWYSGLHQCPIDTEAPHGSALLGVAFHADGGRPWLHADAGLTAERTLPLADLLGDTALALRARLLETADAAARFALVEAWLLARLRPRFAPHAMVRWATRRIADCAGQLAVEDLAREAGVSRKHLGDLFRRDVGLTPKALARVHRFKSALALLSGRAQVPWVALAAHCGYYDQSHLIRDFRAFTGYAPGEFVRHARPDGGSVVVE